MCGGHSHHKHNKSSYGNHSHHSGMKGAWNSHSTSVLWNIIGGIGLIAGILVLLKLLT